MRTGPSDVMRRACLLGVASTAGSWLAGCAAGANTANAASPRAASDHEEDAEVTPGEDLMQEHGVLERILLIYDEAANRIERAEKLDVAIMTAAANIVRRFVEEYHEQTEEQFVFPRLEAARRETDLVTVLRRQHQRGREVTAEIIRSSKASAASSDLVRPLRAFERMYRPHAAREDTVLFPAFRALVGGDAYRELGEQFEEQEHAKLGEHGFEGAVKEVAALEAALGIADLSKFTP
jgi:hemerythrin-like domain-containing protein